MKFTIAIPTYNNSEVLEKAIVCALKQDYEGDYEVLVSNNNSSASTVEILEKYNNRITSITLDKTVTMYENHNVCLNQAQGDYIVFCHSDDKLLPDALSKIFLKLKERGFPQKYVLWGRSLFRDFKYSWNVGGLQLNQIGSGINTLGAFQFGGITPSGTCYHRASINQLGGFLFASHELAPSDFLTMWMLIVNSFEFEMSDRIYFERTKAATATKMKPSDIFNSYEDVFSSLIERLTKEQFNMILDYISSTNWYNINVLKLIHVKKLIPSKIIKIKVLKRILKQPRKSGGLKAIKLLF